MKIRLAKYYRSCRALDGYSDAQCRRMILEARSRRADAMWVIPLAMVGVVAVVVAPVAIIAAILVQRSRAATGSLWGSSATQMILLLAFVGLIVGGAVVWVMTRRVLIMRSVLNHLEKAKCPYCLFSLRGLPIEAGGAVTCPECGQRIVLADEGLTPDDLLGRQERHATWRPGKDEVIELPPIPLEPEEPVGRKKKIRVGTILELPKALEPDRGSKGKGGAGAAGAD